ncbi:MAG: hypothetical protein V4747_07515 [Pseudomonadota bacterium]
MSKLAEIQSDATLLHSLCEGALELLELTTTVASPASNALHGLVVVLIERADKLASDLEGACDAARVKA